MTVGRSHVNTKQLILVRCRLQQFDQFELIAADHSVGIVATVAAAVL